VKFQTDGEEAVESKVVMWRGGCSRRWNWWTNRRSRLRRNGVG